MTPEITKMMTLSTGHVKYNTAQMLDAEPDANALGLSVYPKTCDGESVGWFIYLPETIQNGVPEDLTRAIRYAMCEGCGVLCLDADGPESPSLQSYQDTWP